MTDSATITITSGPDRGKMFQLDSEQVSIGCGADNAIALSDQTLDKHQASIVHRKGRYAIYSPLNDAVEVEGNVIPAECWVWLPETARIRISERTSLQFNLSDSETVAQPAPAPSNPPRQTTGTGKTPRPAPTGKKKNRAKRKLARFITDQVGDPLVQLGEDGLLPEFNLAEGPTQKPSERKQKESNPSILYIVCGLSFLLSILMLFLEASTPGGHSADARARARSAIREFYRSDNAEPAEYQKLLREAQRSHSSGDDAAEQRAYQRVLDLLNSEDNDSKIQGLTGDRERDTELRGLIAILITD